MCKCHPLCWPMMLLLLLLCYALNEFWRCGGISPPPLPNSNQPIHDKQTTRCPKMIH